jgi:hypothetical protein
MHVHQQLRMFVHMVAELHDILQPLRSCCCCCCRIRLMLLGCRCSRYVRLHPLSILLLLSLRILLLLLCLCSLLSVIHLVQIVQRAMHLLKHCLQILQELRTQPSIQSLTHSIFKLAFHA